MLLLRIILAIFSGIIAASAFPPIGFWPLVFVGYSLFFFLIFTSKTKKEAALLGFCQGFAFFLFFHRWLFSFVPFDWLKIEDPVLSWAIISLLSGIGAIAFSIGYALMAFFVWGLKQRRKWWQVSFLTALIWVVGEYSLAFLGGLLLWAPELPRFVPWPTFSIGNLLVAFPQLTALASIGGIWLITFFVIIISSLISLGILTIVRKKGNWQAKTRVSFSVFLTALLFFSGWWLAGYIIIDNYHSQNKNAKIINLALIQTELGDDENIPARLNGLLKEAAASDPDLIVAGEIIHDSLPKILLEKKGISPIIVGERTRISANGLKENELVAFQVLQGKTECKNEDNLLYCTFGPQENVIASSSKQVLMPFGEYMPFLAKKGLELLGRNVFLERFNYNRQITAQKQENPFLQIEVEETTVGVMACGAFLTTMPRQLIGQETEIIATPASWQRFHSNKTALRMMMAFVQVRAIELGRPIAQATHGGESFIAYPDGSLLSSGVDNDYVLMAEVPQLGKATFYHRFGDWFPWPAFAVLLLITFREKLRRKKTGITNSLISL